MELEKLPAGLNYKHSYSLGVSEECDTDHARNGDGPVGVPHRVLAAGIGVLPVRRVHLHEGVAGVQHQLLVGTTHPD